MEERIRKKLHSSKAFTLAETLLAVLILLMVSTIVATGIPVARNAYEKVVLASNAEVLLSTTISFIAGLVVNYIICTKWIFRKSKISNTILEFIFYGIIGVVGLLLNDILMFVFTDMIQVHYMISKLITAVIVMGWNFIGRRTLLFKN